METPLHVYMGTPCMCVGPLSDPLHGNCCHDRCCRRVLMYASLSMHPYRGVLYMLVHLQTDLHTYSHTLIRMRPQHYGASQGQFVPLRLLVSSSPCGSIICFLFSVLLSSAPVCIVPLLSRARLRPYCINVHV